MEQMEQEREETPKVVVLSPTREDKFNHHPGLRSSQTGHFMSFNEAAGYAG